MLYDVWSVPLRVLHHVRLLHTCVPCFCLNSFSCPSVPKTKSGTHIISPSPLHDSNASSHEFSNPQRPPSIHERARAAKGAGPPLSMREAKVVHLCLRPFSCPSVSKTKSGTHGTSPSPLHDSHATSDQLSNPQRPPSIGKSKGSKRSRASSKHAGGEGGAGGTSAVQARLSEELTTYLRR